MRDRAKHLSKLRLAAAAPLVFMLASCSSGGLDDPASASPTSSPSSVSQACADLNAVAEDIAVLDAVDYAAGNADELTSDLESLSTHVQDYAKAAGDDAKAQAADLGLATEVLATAVQGLGDTTTTGEVVTALSGLTSAYDAAEIASEC